MASGLSIFIKTYKFVAMFSDVLSPLANLLRAKER